jgi:O-antigen/teichoic acid export membrane protein
MRDRWLKRAMQNVIGQVASMLVSILDRVLVVGLLLRYWGPDRFSDWSVLQATALVLSFAEFGIQTYFLNLQQAAFARNDRDGFARSVALALGIYGALSVALAAGLAMAVLLVGTSIFTLQTIDPSEARYVFLLLGLGVIVGFGRAVVSSVYAATGRFARAVVLQALIQLVLTCATIAAILLGGGPVALATIFFLAWGPGGLAVSLHDMRRTTEWARLAPAFPRIQELRDGIRHVKWFAFQQGGPVLWLQLPVMILNYFNISGTLLASFLVLRTCANLIRQLISFAVLGVGIEIAAILHRDSEGRTLHLAQETGISISALSGAIAAVLLGMGEPLIYHWTRDAALFDPVIAALLVAPVLLTAPLQSVISLLQFSNQSAAVGIPRLLQVGFGFFLCIAGAWRFGIIGVAAGLALAETVALWFSLSFAPSSFFGEPSVIARYFFKAALATISAALWSVLVADALQRMISPWTLGGFLVDAALWAILAILPAGMLSLPSHARQRMMAAMSAYVDRA